jgi:hypothetical protein
MQDTQFEGMDVNDSQTIIHDTGTAGEGTKRDQWSHDTASGGLAGNQVVKREVVHYTEHLPYSPAEGFGEQKMQFAAGHRWTEAEGKVHDGVGPQNSPF